MSDNAISTNNVWPNYAKGNTSGTSTTGTGMLGKNDFFRILAAQLANQDPMQPMEDKEFIAQMAQFSSVEQMTNMTETLQLLRQSIGLSPALIGKSVAWEITDTAGKTLEKTGVVDGIKFKDGLQYAMIGEESISIDELTRIWETADEPADTGSETAETPVDTGSETTEDAVSGS